VVVAGAGAEAEAEQTQEEQPLVAQDFLHGEKGFLTYG